MKTHAIRNIVQAVIFHGAAADVVSDDTGAAEMT
jgi:hypothetical protein